MLLARSLSALILLIVSINAQITPIVNASGEYFIVTTSNAANNASIMCNSSIPNCFVICQGEDVCTNINITCSSSNCDIKCDTKTCQNINIDISNSTIASLSCKNENSCQSMTVSSSNAQQIVNSSVNIMCDGLSSCSNSKIQTNHNTLTLNCPGESSCNNQIIDSQQNKLFVMNCYGGSNTHLNCDASTLTVNQNSSSTTLNCNGVAYSSSCADMKIGVPQSYQPKFIDILYVGPDGREIAAGDESAQDLQIYCINNDGDKIDCGGDVTFPIIGIAKPDKRNSSGDYYTNNLSGYQYRFKTINCNQTDKICDIQCNGDESCNYLSIYNQGIGNVNCSAEGVCQGITISSSGPSMNMECAFYAACGEISVVSPSSSNISIYCDGSTPNAEETACTNFDIDTKGDIDITCIGDHGCDGIKLESQGHTSLSCKTTSSCQSVTIIESQNGAYIECLNTTSCTELDATVAGDFEVVCSGSQSCMGSQWTISGQTYPNRIQCSGDNSCDNIQFSTYSNDVNMVCDGCGLAQVTLYNADNYLKLECENLASCDQMNVMTDGAVSLTCAVEQACFNTFVTPRDHQQASTPKGSDITCTGDLACNNLDFVVASNITVFCTVGDNVCTTSNIQSLNGDMSITCGGVSTGMTVSESCKDAVFIAGGKIDLICEGDEACSGLSVIGGDEFVLDCTGDGNSICNDMMINMTSRTANNVYKCGIAGNSSNGYSCVGSSIQTYAKDIRFDCYNSGCYGVDIITNNPESLTTMTCERGFACSLMKFISNGMISLECTGSKTCDDAYIRTYGGIQGAINCSDWSSCVSMEVDTPSNLTFNCNGAYSCQLLKINAQSIEMNCKDDYACQQANITGNGNLLLNCGLGGDSTCAQMAVNMILSPTTKVMKNTLNCGDESKANVSYAYACSNTVINTYADIIDVNCQEIGCYGTEINALNRESILSMDCQNYDACNGVKVNSNGKIGLNCTGGLACSDAYFKTDNAADPTMVNCMGDDSCVSLEVDTLAPLSYNCNGARSCQLSTLSADAITMNCNGIIIHLYKDLL